MPVFVESRHPGEAIMSEGNGNISRENIIVAESQTIDANELVARRAVPASITATATPNDGNAADAGALTMADPAVSSEVKDGVYRVTCIEPAVDAGTFQIEDPTGRMIGIVHAGEPYDGEIKFTIGIGEADFVAGDGFEVKVQAIAEHYEHVAFDPDGADGSDVPVGMSIYPVTTGAGQTKKASAISRLATLNGQNVAWPDDITDDQKTDAIQALAARNIIVRW
jgi:hypothetical protein